MADTLKRMLESGKLTDEQCLSILRGIDLDEEMGGCTSEITPVDSRKRKKIAIQGTNEEEEVDNRKPLLQLLDMRKLPNEEKKRIFCQYEELGVEEDMDYIWQIANTQGFDFNPDVRIPRLKGYSPFYFGENEEQPPTEMVLYGRLGVHWFNFEQKRKLEFIRIPKLNTEHPFSFSYFITVEVKDDDAAAADSLTLQTLVRRPSFPELKLLMERCRIKPAEISDHSFNCFYQSFRGCMPTFLSELPEEADDDDGVRFYEVQAKDIDNNDWLRLYTEFALFQVCEAGSHSFLPEQIKMKKILVETPEPHTDPSLKLDSMNAIFHISFRANSCDYTSVFLHERIKVDRKAGALGDSVTITREKNKITVTSDGKSMQPSTPKQKLVASSHPEVIIPEPTRYSSVDPLNPSRYTNHGDPVPLIAAALTLVMGQRYLLTGKIMPAGLVAGISALMTCFYVYKISTGGNKFPSKAE
ncbi:unnamed protein product [Arabidopsis arenosa]|uniref:Uncharacterized protein n=1 Tax=Arabidopsis arenosa TaxID=38785 RepID=A0A8S2A0L4_ARAAE|nr:unnamed protein product [Arabidopsis arenosa]